MKDRTFTATVKDREGDQPCFIVIEGLEIGGETLMLDMRRGTGAREAQELARLLNERVRTIGPLKLSGEPAPAPDPARLPSARRLRVVPPNG